MTTQDKSYRELEMALKLACEQRDEFQVQRDAARQLAYDLSEHCKSINRQWPDVPYPNALIAKVDLSRGIGCYKFPLDREGEKIISRYYNHPTAPHIRNIAQEHSR